MTAKQIKEMAIPKICIPASQSYIHNVNLDFLSSISFILEFYCSEASLKISVAILSISRCHDSKSYHDDFVDAILSCEHFFYYFDLFNFYLNFFGLDSADACECGFDHIYSFWETYKKYSPSSCSLQADTTRG